MILETVEESREEIGDAFPGPNYVCCILAWWAYRY